MQLDKGDYPENWPPVFCVDRLRSLEPFMCSATAKQNWPPVFCVDRLRSLEPFMCSARAKPKKAYLVAKNTGDISGGRSGGRTISRKRTSAQRKSKKIRERKNKRQQGSGGRGGGGGGGIK